MEYTEAHQHFEAGVLYSWLTYPTIEPVAHGMVPHTFNWSHASSGKSGTRTVYLWPERRMPSSNLLRLVNHWNRGGGDWRYWA